MSIWHHETTPEKLNKLSTSTLVAHLGMSFSEIGDDYISATMPVDERTVQPAGLLHGGASVALAETLGSFAAYLAVDTSRFSCVGLEINANHVRAMTKGVVTGTARPLHLGRKTQLWEIRIVDAADRLVCVSRLTIAVIDRPSDVFNAKLSSGE